MQDKIMIATKRYAQPRIFCSSNSCSLRGDCCGILFFPATSDGALCIMLMVNAPITHSNVPKILILL